MPGSEENSGSRPQVIVAQLGARMHYAVPVLLHRAGMLARLYTDAYVGKGSPLWMFSQASHLLPEAWRPPMVKKLLGRREDGLPPEKVTSFNLFGASYAMAQYRARNGAMLERIFMEYGRRFCDLILRHNLKSADACYALSSVALPIFRWARDHDMGRILEQISSPALIDYTLVAEEKNLWPGWEMPYPDRQVWQPRIDRESREWELADTIICGSAFVAQGLTSLGVLPEKVRVVPYGVDISRFNYQREPWDGRRPLRVLFVGAVSLRKGHQYLYQALDKLNSRRISARMVGPITIREPYRTMVTKRADLTGMVPRTEVRRHYQWADVFVFPSICEGSATVTYEALAAGLPVITTPNAGSVVRDGIDGFIVPIRDATAIADCIERLARNPELLQEMSENARAQSREYSWDRYRERLVAVILRKQLTHTI